MSKENEINHDFTLLNKLRFFTGLMIASRICELCHISHIFYNDSPSYMAFNCVSLISVIAQLLNVSANWAIVQASGLATFGCGISSNPTWEWAWSRARASAHLNYCVMAL